MAGFAKRLAQVQGGLCGSRLLLPSGDEPGAPNANFFYLTGVDADGCLLVASKNSCSIVTSKMNEEYVIKQASGQNKKLNVITYDSNDALVKILSNQLKGAKTLRLDFQKTKLSTSAFLKKLTRAKIVDASQALLAARAVKSEEEKALIKKAVRITENIYLQLEGLLRAGMGERQAAVLVQKLMLDAGVEPSFSPIVATGANSSFPHSVPTGAKIKSHLLVDIGVRCGNYCSDLTRCFFFGQGKSGRERQAYDKLVEITHELCDRAKSGEFDKGRQLAQAGERLMEKSGLPKMIHSFGHGVGLEVHERPSLGLKSQDRLEKGCVVAIEPAAYFSGKFGVRHEVDLLL
ncbi:aminopeptidase P family protein [Candidatus Parvarchaeota archaeon]|nr:aminopeptidase P family protein [Candidatus Parvarchaeota archaeon]